jgi:hypothetical protein
MLTNRLKSIVENPFSKRLELNAGANPTCPSIPGGRGDRGGGADAECADQNES